MDLLPFQSKRKLTVRGLLRKAQSFSFAENYAPQIKVIFDDADAENLESIRKAGSIAILLEVLDHVRKQFPKTWEKVSSEFDFSSLLSDSQSHIFTILKEKTTLYTTYYSLDATSSTSVFMDVPFVLTELLSPVVFAQLPGNSIPLWVCDSIVVLLEALKFCLEESEQPKKLINLLPATYQKYVKKTLLNEETLLKLSEFLHSRKKAKKYLRIILKRLGIFSRKKPPFSVAKKRK